MKYIHDEFDILEPQAAPTKTKLKCKDKVRNPCGKHGGNRDFIIL